jgi:ATP dependent DNA ligase domain
MLYAFDLLELDGEDLRTLPLGDRKKRLASLFARRRVGIVLSAHTTVDGATIFQQACKMGLEGIGSNRLSAPYRAGPSRDWIKVKNPDSPAMVRHRPLVTMDEMEAFLDECRADPWFQGRPDLTDRLEGLLTEFYLAGEGPEWQATWGSSSGGSRPQR